MLKKKKSKDVEESVTYWQGKLALQSWVTIEEELVQLCKT